MGQTVVIKKVDLVLLLISPLLLLLLDFPQTGVLYDMTISILFSRHVLQVKQLFLQT